MIYWNFYSNSSYIVKTKKIDNQLTYKSKIFVWAYLKIHHNFAIVINPVITANK